MTNKELVFQAVEKLRAVKGIPIWLRDLTADTDTFNSFIIHIYNAAAGEEHKILLAGEAFTDQARDQNPDEPTNLSFDDLRVVRIARVIFDYYQTQQRQNIHSSILNNSSTILNSAPISSTLNASSISLGSLTLCANTITDLEDKIKDLSKELEDVKNNRDDLLIKVMTLEAELKAKGVI